MTIADYDFDSVTHEPLYKRAVWTPPNSSSITVLVIAWSLGATRAYCLITADVRLISGNFTAVWLPANQLSIAS